MKRMPVCLLAFGALGLLAQVRAAHAQVTYFTTDTTINTALSGDAEVGRDINQNNFSPTVSLVTGGSISGKADIWNSSVFNMSGGSIGTAGAFDSLFSFDTSQVNISGGSIIGGVYAFATSVINITDGNIPAGPSANGVVADGNSTINVSGGTNGIGLTAFSQGTINVRGGALLSGTELFAQDSGKLNFFGSNLKARLTSTGGGLKIYMLSGNLDDGSDLTGIQMFISDSGSFTLNGLGSPEVPEPGSLALLGALGMMGAGLLRRKCRR